MAGATTNAILRQPLASGVVLELVVWQYVYLRIPDSDDEEVFVYATMFLENWYSC